MLFSPDTGGLLCSNGSGTDCGKLIGVELLFIDCQTLFGWAGIGKLLLVMALILPIFKFRLLLFCGKLIEFTCPCNCGEISGIPEEPGCCIC